jgi:hypothetical protein
MALGFVGAHPCGRWFCGACATPITHGVGSYKDSFQNKK